MYVPFELIQSVLSVGGRQSFSVKMHVFNCLHTVFQDGCSNGIPTTYHRVSDAYLLLACLTWDVIIIIFCFQTCHSIIISNALVPIRVINSYRSVLRRRFFADQDVDVTRKTWVLPYLSELCAAGYYWPFCHSFIQSVHQCGPKSAIRLCL